MTTEADDRRRAPRYQTRLNAVVAVAGEKLFDCLVLDVNAYGAKLEAGGHAVPDQFHLVEVHGPLAYSARVMWRHGSQVGTRFMETWDSDDPTAPAWIKAVRMGALRAHAQTSGIRLVWSSPRVAEHPAKPGRTEAPPQSA